MKILLCIILSTISFITYVEINKCEINGKLVFQSAPCPEGTQKEFKLSTDISREDQQAAAKKLQADIERWDEEKRLKKEAEDKERKIQAAEDLARNVERSEARTVYEKSNDDWAGIRYGVERPLLKRKLIKNKLPTRLR
jgi:hypothetical protein